MLTIYHNPRCSKSRQTLQLIQDADKEVDIIEYLKTPPNEATIRRLLTMLALSPRDLMRSKETEYKALNLGDDSLSEDALIQAMVTTPKLIERPIVVNGDRAIIGRPPENVLSLL